MNTLPIIEHDLYSTSLLSPVDESPLYAVATRRHPDGYWVDVVYRLEQNGSRDDNPSKSEKPTVHTELATVFYIDAGTTRVRFGDHETELGLDAFLRRRHPHSNSRIFVGADGVTYKWRMDGKNLELLNTATHKLIARSQPRRSKSPFPVSFPRLSMHLTRSIPTISASRTATITFPTTTATVNTPYTTRTSYPTLSLHPGLLSLDSASYHPQLLDGIVLTFFIMQRLLKERLRFRYP
ncbi:hypothetical protein JB92DRAFT_2998586 [Gautieria morchelliformis]|nr:hypothetical protein JB92DRAFT_2998586 [Gautieria morchelliformis]